MLLTVTGTPTKVNSEMIGEYMVQLSWTAPASSTPPIAGYEVFYAVLGSNIAQSAGTTTNTTISVTLPNLTGIYNFLVVAFSDAANVLPSAHSSNTTIYLSKFNYMNNKAIFLRLW